MRSSREKHDAPLASRAFDAPDGAIPMAVQGGEGLLRALLLAMLLGLAVGVLVASWLLLR